MALLHYFTPVRNGGLPDPEGALSSILPLQAIEQANQEVSAITQEEVMKKRGPYKDSHPRQRAPIGKYACKNGMVAAARQLSRPINESSARSINLVEQTRKRRAKRIHQLPSKKRGRPTLLWADLDKKVQVYIRKVRKGGGTVSNRVVIAAARGILLKCDRTMLVEYGGPVLLNKR